jgi:transcriptional regulator with XRE-family HTH domain
MASSNVNNYVATRQRMVTMSYAKFGYTIAEFVKRFREANDLSQGDLAKLMKVHRQYISNVERRMTNQRNPVLFCMRLKPHLDKERQKFLDDLLQESIYDSIDEKMKVRTKKKKGKNK